MTNQNNFQQLIEHEEHLLNEKKSLLKAVGKSVDRLRAVQDDIAINCDKLIRSHGMNQSTLLAGLGLEPAEVKFIAASLRSLSNSGSSKSQTVSIHTQDSEASSQE